MVVDESALVRATVRNALQARGLEVHTAASLPEARSLLERETPDLIVMEATLPGNGQSLLKMVQAHPAWSRIRLLFMSAPPLPADLEAAIEEAGIAFLPKPFSLEELWEAVEALLGGGSGEVDAA